MEVLCCHLLSFCGSTEPKMPPQYRHFCLVSPWNPFRNEASVRIYPNPRIHFSWMGNFMPVTQMWNKRWGSACWNKKNLITLHIHSGFDKGFKRVLFWWTAWWQRHMHWSEMTVKQHCRQASVDFLGRSRNTILLLLVLICCHNFEYK